MEKNESKSHDVYNFVFWLLVETTIMMKKNKMQLEHRIAIRNYSKVSWCKKPPNHRICTTQAANCIIIFDFSFAIKYINNNAN